MKAWPFDAYDTRARAWPLVNVVSPLAVLVGAWSSNAWDAVAGLLSLAGMPVLAYALLYALHQWVRDCGYDIEKKLWFSWGGPPTTRFLRHSDKFFREAVTHNFHARIAELKKGWRAPTAEEERQSPKEADQQYEVAIKWLKSAATKAPRYHLVEDANRRYGFRRNCLGIRNYGLAVCVVSIIAHGYIIAMVWPPEGSEWLILLSLLFTAIEFFFWIGVNDAFVHKAARVYAERLLECLEGL